jgi:adenine-specific DNA-methyltransferase
MEKLKLETPDLTQQNIDRIAELFPSAITETKDENGKLKRAINFSILKQLLSDEVVDGEECYEFTWVGKKQSIIEGNRPIRKTLRPAKEESKNWDTTENLYIEGDNLEVLKLLQNSYLNSIKMIYIDPPYNTGNDFIYRDDFKVSREEYEDEIGVYDEDDNRLFKNTETNGRFHSDWCSMMYPRLQLARNLLSDDGVIFISIDDNEVDNLRKICDEVFGESNFIANIIWRGGKRNLAKWISTSHEYMVLYAKNSVYCSLNNISWKENKKGIDEIYKQVDLILKQTDYNYKLSSEKLKQWYKDLPEDDFSKEHQHYRYIDKKGIYCMDNVSRVGGGKYDVVSPLTGNKIKCPTRGWTYGKEEDFWKAYKQGVIEFTSNDKLPIFKRYLHNNETQLVESVFYKDRRGGSNRLRALMDGEIFPFPKDEEVIKEKISAFAPEDAIILDFFSGSASTAHAVMQLNAEDGGNRKFIMVQLPEATDEKSEAYKAGYKNICEIGKERIRRAGKKIEEELEAKSNKGDLFDDEKEVKTVDTGFRVLKVDDTNMKDVYYSAGEYSQQMLLNLESNIKEDRNDMDLLYGVLLDWGVPLSLPHTTETIEGKRVHFVNEDNLVACFEESVSEAVVREIAKRKPERVVFRDSSFSSSPEKINVTEIFKTLSPDTTVKVI